MASVRFGGDALNPGEVTRLLGSPPTLGRRKGELMRPDGVSKAVARTGVWLLKATPRSPGDLDAQVAELLDQLIPDLAVWRDLAARYQADLSCGLFMDESNEWLGLTARTLQALGERRLSLGLDIYDPPLDI